VVMMRLCLVAPLLNLHISFGKRDPDRLLGHWFH
jgi:hypothetical protein